MFSDRLLQLILPAFTDFPMGVTSGTYPAHTLDLTMASSYNPAFITAHGMNVAQAEADFIAGILGGQSYLNIHTVINGGGEIRAQLVPLLSSALDCRVSCWRAAFFSLGGDGVSGLLEQKPFGTRLGGNLLIRHRLY